MNQALELLSVLLPCVVGVALMAVAGFVLRNGSVHRYNLFFGGYFLLSGLKSFSEGIDAKATAFHDSSPLFPPELFWIVLGAFAALVMTPTLLLFIATFPRPLERIARRPLAGLVLFVPSLVIGILLVGYLADRVPLADFAIAQQAFNIYGSLLTALALVHVLRATRSSESFERTQARFVAIGLAPGFVMGWVITVLFILPDYGVMTAPDAVALITDLVHFVSPVLELLAAGAVAFAILRFNILGVTQRFRLGVKSFLVGFIFVVVFLLTQFVENVVLQGQLFGFAGDYGSFMLSGITGIVLFKPIELVSAKAADRLVPRPKAADESARRNAEVYRAQCTYVLRDAQVTPREMDFLRNLRDQLGLTAQQAAAIEEDVERTLKVDAPEVGRSGLA